MEKILDTIRSNKSLHSNLRRIYGKTVGLWFFKEKYAKFIGFYNGKKFVKLLDENKSNKVIIKKIKSDKPFMLARYGSTEFRNLFNSEINSLYLYSGFFPKNKKLLKKFREVYIKSSKYIDILAVWNYKTHFIKKIKLIRRFSNISNIIPLNTIGDNNHLWIKALENKKVLVIHPFKKTIEYQYKRMDKLKILPKLKSLQVIKAIQTLANNRDKRFETWFDALDFMKKEIDKKDFDIAIIGCGAYGLPLAAHVKSIGKQAIHLGGSLQLLFGIKGHRWKKHGNKKFNKLWISPLAEDTPKDYKKLEGGSYW